MPRIDLESAPSPEHAGLALQSESTCRICGGPLGRSGLGCRDNVVSGELFHLLSCVDCKSLTTDPFPEAARIARYYPKSYLPWGTGSGPTQRLYSAARAFSTRLRARRAERSSSRSPGAILDVGCGDGTFLRAMQQRGWLSHGIEPSPTARQVTSQRSILVYESADQLSPPPGGYDLVTFWHALEHMHDLDGAIASVAAVLTPNGRILIAVPNFRSLDAAYYGERWAAYDVPRHLHHFGIDGIVRLARRHGFVLTNVHPLRGDVLFTAIVSERGRSLLRIVRGLSVAAMCVSRSLFSPRSASSLLFTLEVRRSPSG